MGAEVLQQDREGITVISRPGGDDRTSIKKGLGGAAEVTGRSIHPVTSPVFPLTQIILYYLSCPQNELPGLHFTDTQPGHARHRP